jgi:hypothetical protein
LAAVRHSPAALSSPAMETKMPSSASNTILPHRRRGPTHPDISLAMGRGNERILPTDEAEGDEADEN